MSIVSKTIPGEEITNSEYFDYRYVLIACSVTPPIVFNFQRRLLLFIGVGPFLLSLVFFDKLHELFGVGFYQINHEIDSYPTTTWVSSLMFLVLATVLFMLRWSSDSLQLEKNDLIDSLKSAKKKLRDQNKEIKAAHEQIQLQNVELNEKNDLLSKSIQLANKELQDSNAELIKHNNELKQFSHTVSHNLKGPIGNILHISELVRVVPEGQKEEYLDYLLKAAKLLDSNIRDLGAILDIRRDIFRVRRKVEFKVLLDEILFSYEKKVEEIGATIDMTLVAGSIYTIKPFLVSILDNLFSNAIKYHSSKRVPEIKIKTARKGKNTIITIWDNGIGIDLKTHEKDLFKMYMRFNNQAEGKGIGLYLVMKQLESLAGNIKVKSELDSFTEFTVTLPDLEDVQHQPLIEEAVMSLTYDADTDYLCLKWKESAESDLYRRSLERVLDTAKSIEPKGLVLDLNQGYKLSKESRDWVLKKYLPRMSESGIRQILFVHEHDLTKEDHDFYNKTQDILTKVGIERVLVGDASYPEEVKEVES